MNSVKSVLSGFTFGHRCEVNTSTTIQLVVTICIVVLIMLIFLLYVFKVMVCNSLACTIVHMVQENIQASMCYEDLANKIPIKIYDSY